MSLGGSFRETSPSRSMQPVAALPRAEDLLDAAADPMDRPVPGVQARERLLLVAAPIAVRITRGVSPLVRTVARK